MLFAEENKFKLMLTPMLVCKIAILSCFIPNRGPILGINSATLLVLCCIAQFLLTRRKLSAPWFYILYVISVVACIFVHFGSRTAYIHFINICQVIGTVYVVLVAIRGDRNKFEEIIEFLIKVFMIYAVFGIIESFTKINIFDTLTGTQVVYEYANAFRFGLARSRGATGVSINNGMLLCLAEGIIAYQLLKSNNKKKLYTIAYIVVFINCFLTLSRGIWLDLIISQFLIFLSLRGGRKLLLIFKIAITAIILLVIGMILFPIVIRELLDILNIMINSIIVSLSGGSASDEMGGIGNRFELWGWVWISVKDSLIWGKGFDSPFVYLTSDGAIKKSIEVMWLYLLYRTGIVGMLGFIWLQISCMAYSIRMHFKENAGKVSNRSGFNYIFLVVSIAYYITMFSCAGSEELIFYYFFIALLFAYNSLNPVVDELST